MGFPLSDDDSDRRMFPVVNVVLIAINVFVFVVLQGMGRNDGFTLAFSTVPQEMVGRQGCRDRKKTIKQFQTADGKMSVVLCRG